MWIYVSCSYQHQNISLHRTTKTKPIHANVSVVYEWIYETEFSAVIFTTLPIYVCTSTHTHTHNTYILLLNYVHVWMNIKFYAASEMFERNAIKKERKRGWAREVCIKEKREHKFYKIFIYSATWICIWMLVSMRIPFVKDRRRERTIPNGMRKVNEKTDTGTHTHKLHNVSMV